MTLYIIKNGERQGPFTIDQLVGQIRKGEFLLSDLSWREGMTDWQPIHTIQDVVDAVMPELPAGKNDPLNQNSPPAISIKVLEDEEKTKKSPGLVNTAEETAQRPNSHSTNCWKCGKTLSFKDKISSGPCADLFKKIPGARLCSKCKAEQSGQAEAKANNDREQWLKANPQNQITLGTVYALGSLILLIAVMAYVLFVWDNDLRPIPPKQPSLQDYFDQSGNYRKPKPISLQDRPQINPQHIHPGTFYFNTGFLVLCGICGLVKGLVLIKNGTNRINVQKENDSSSPT